MKNIYVTIDQKKDSNNIMAHRIIGSHIRIKLHIYPMISKKDIQLTARNGSVEDPWFFFSQRNSKHLSCLTS